jgi:hypothetical protein
VNVTVYHWGNVSVEHWWNVSVEHWGNVSVEHWWNVTDLEIQSTMTNILYSPFCPHFQYNAALIPNYTGDHFALYNKFVS